MAIPALPARISWAVERLGLSGKEAVLEVGCGRGAAAALVGERLTAGRLVAIDRSSTAAAATRDRPENRANLTLGRLEVITSALADLSGYEAAFDIVFAINVNVFWLDPKREMPVIRRVLKPGGALALFYETPSSDRVEETAERVEAKLAEHDFVASIAGLDAEGRLLHVEARARG